MISRPPHPQRLPRATVRDYAVGSIATGGFNTLPGLVLLFYLTDVLGVTAALAGLVVALSKIWDVVIDPVIGAGSDRSLARSGSRRFFLRVGASTVGVFFVLTFAAPPLPDALAAAWVTLAFLASATAFSVFQVPYLALPAEMTADYDERTRLLTWRIVALTVAILLFGGAMPALRNQFADERTGYLVMALASAVLIAAAMWMASRSAPVDRVGTTPGDTEKSGGLGAAYREGWRAYASSQPFRALFWSFFLKSLASGLMLAVGQYVATWILGEEAAITWIFLALIAPALFATPLWGRAAVRWGKEPLVYAASGLFAAATLSLLPLLWWPGPWLYVSMAVAGVGFAGLQSLPMSILPDVVARETRLGGRDNAATYTGVWTAGETTGLALGALLLSVMLEASGYLSTTQESAVQPDSAITAIVLAVSVVPTLLVLGSLLVFRRYRLRRADFADPALEESPDQSPT